LPKHNRLQNIKKGEGRLVGPSGNYSIYSEGNPSCTGSCPAGVDVKAYVNLIADRRYEDAVQVVRLANPFPGICGRVCTHPCEAECGRKDIDASVSIRSLKRFATDYELSRRKPTVAAHKKYSQKIAIVGGGPAGLTAASDLALAGFDVTVFDSAKDAGGLLSWGIPDFRLPKNIVRGEVHDIEALGVHFSLGEKVLNPVKFIMQGYSAVIIATGCQNPVFPGIPGESSQGVLDCLDFLRKVSDRKITEMTGNVIVVGGGNAALDSARTALRLGAKVTVAYRRTEEQMPADSEEIEHAKQEGVIFKFLAIPAEIIPDKGHAGLFRFQSAKLGEPDSSGRRSPVPIPNDYFTLEADRVIMAIGSKPDSAKLAEAGIGLAKSGAVTVDESGMASVRGIFACGDITTGPLTIIEAIAGGHRAASGVVNYLLGEQLRTKPAEMLVVEAPKSAESQRCEACLISAEKRQSTFEEVELGMDERTAITEALRCRRCGSCGVCDLCLAVCDYRNAKVTVHESGEKAIAKVPFKVAAEAMDHPEGWRIEAGKIVSNVKIEPLLARVDNAVCIACGKCEEACPYKAIRTVFGTDGNAVAKVEETACRGCGACTAACPAGAVAMGFLGDKQLIARILEAVRHSSENNGVVRFSCMWNRRNARTETWPWEVRVQCTRRLSPAVFTETLARGARAVTVLGCGEDDCHYVPGPWMGPDVVESTREILDAININPGRVAYVDTPDSVDGFFTAIANLNDFEHCSEKYPETEAGLGRCMNAIQILMTQPDRVVTPNSSVLLGYGCLAMSEQAFRAYGLQDSDVLEQSVRLLRKTGIRHALAPGIQISGTSLKDWGLDTLYVRYTESVAGTLNTGRVRKLIMPTPKSYESFMKMKLDCTVVSLPSVLKERLTGAFLDTPMTAAYHPACAGGGEFDTDCLELLGKVPGLKIVKITGKCGDSGWRNVSAESGKMAKDLLKKAEDSGAEMIIAGSNRCACHLKAVTGGWNTSPVKVMDIYSFLASRLGGEE